MNATVQEMDGYMMKRDIKEERPPFQAEKRISTLND